MLALKRIFHSNKVVDFFSFIYCSLITLLFNGCSTNFSSEPSYFPWVAKYEPEVQYLPPKTKSYDMEEDGLPAQLPPSKRIRTLPDDPSQPWSINYGKETVYNPIHGDNRDEQFISNEIQINVSQQKK